MEIQKSEDSIILKLSSKLGAEELQRIIDYIEYLEATIDSRATQKAVDNLAQESKANWWKKNKSDYLK